MLRENLKCSNGFMFIQRKFYFKSVKFSINSDSEISLVHEKIVRELNTEDLSYKISKRSLVGANIEKVYEVNKRIIGELKYDKMK